MGFLKEALEESLEKYLGDFLLKAQEEYVEKLLERIDEEIPGGPFSIGPQ